MVGLDSGADHIGFCIQRSSKNRMIIMNGVGDINIQESTFISFDMPTTIVPYNDTSGVGLMTLASNLSDLYLDLKTALAEENTGAQAPLTSKSIGRLKRLQASVTSEIKNVHVSKVYVIAISHASVIAALMIKRLVSSIEVNPDHLTKLYVYTLGSPRYLRKDLNPYNNHGVLNFYHIKDPFMEKLKMVQSFMMGVRIPNLSKTLPNNLPNFLGHPNYVIDSSTNIVISDVPIYDMSRQARKEDFHVDYYNIILKVTTNCYSGGKVRHNSYTATTKRVMIGNVSHIVYVKPDSRVHYVKWRSKFKKLSDVRKGE